MGLRVSQLAAAASLVATELLPLSKLSTTVTITATTLSAQASDNSFNDSGSGFVTAGFAVGDAVRVSGFTGNSANNIFSAVVTVLTAGKMIIGGADGNVIADDAAGESVTITKWESKRTTVQDLVNLASSGTLPWFDVTDPAYGADPTFAADSTNAFQDAIDAAIAAGGGVVLIPNGHYKWGGPLQDTARSNAQVLLPRLHTASDEQITVVLCGATPPSPIPSVAAAVILPEHGVVIESTLTGASGGSPCMLGGWGPSGSAANFSNVHVVIENICFRLPTNPDFSAVDLSHMACAEIDRVVIDTGEYDVRAASLTEPTTTSSYGLVMPKQSNGAHSVIGSCDVIGFYWGYQFAEHANGVNVNAWGCKRAFQFSATDHASVFQRMMAVHCEQVLVAGSGAHRLQIQQLNIEHAASGWSTTDYDINDASGYLTGDLSWHVVLAGTGADSTFTVNGAAAMRYRRVGGADIVQTVASAGTVTPHSANDLVEITALAVNLTLANPGGTPYPGWAVAIRLKDNGTARAISYGSQYRAIGVTLPTTTVIGKTMYLAGIWNVADTKLDIVAVAEEA